MASESQENQLELFELRNQAARRPHRETLGRFLLQLRYDQLVLTGMAGIIGLTVVFACGVERGKQLVRAERSMLARQPRIAPPAAPAESDTAPAASESKKKTPDTPAQVPSTTGTKVKRATKLASAARGSSRYAVQVVTYTKPQVARKEVARLHADGERAFLVIRGGRTRVYVGPFPSKTNAADKVAALKSRYQDCFVRAL